MTKRYRKKITAVLSLVLPVIVLFAILNCFTTYVFYEDFPTGEGGPKGRMRAGEQFQFLEILSKIQLPQLHQSAPLRSAASFPGGKVLPRSRSLRITLG